MIQSRMGCVWPWEGRGMELNDDLTERALKKVAFAFPLVLAAGDCVSGACGLREFPRITLIRFGS